MGTRRLVLQTNCLLMTDLPQWPVTPAACWDTFQMAHCPATKSDSASSFVDLNNALSHYILLNSREQKKQIWKERWQLVRSQTSPRCEGGARLAAEPFRVDNEDVISVESATSKSYPSQEISHIANNAKLWIFWMQTCRVTFVRTKCMYFCRNTVYSVATIWLVRSVYSRAKL